MNKIAALIATAAMVAAPHLACAQVAGLNNGGSPFLGISGNLTSSTPTGTPQTIYTDTGSGSKVEFLYCSSLAGLNAGSPFLDIGVTPKAGSNVGLFNTVVATFAGNGANHNSGPTNMLANPVSGNQWFSGPLPSDANGNPFIYLAPGMTLTVSLESSIGSGTLNCWVMGEQF